MSFDLRRCSKEDLDRLNEEGRIWRERNNPAKEEPPIEAVPAVPAFARAAAGKQLNLFGEETDG